MATLTPAKVTIISSLKSFKTGANFNRKLYRRGKTMAAAIAPATVNAAQTPVSIANIIDSSTTTAIQ